MTRLNEEIGYEEGVGEMTARQWLALGEHLPDSYQKPWSRYVDERYNRIIPSYGPKRWKEAFGFDKPKGSGPRGRLELNDIIDMVKQKQIGNVDPRFLLAIALGGAGAVGGREITEDFKKKKIARYKHPVLSPNSRTE